MTTVDPMAVSLLEDLEQIVTGAGIEGLEAEIVENEKIGAAEGLDEARTAASPRASDEVLAELWPATDRGRSDCRGRVSGRW